MVAQAEEKAEASLRKQKVAIPTGAEMIGALQSQGFVAVRQKGSHVILERTGDGETSSVAVPVHGSRNLATGTFFSLLRQSGLSLGSFVGAGNR